MEIRIFEKEGQFAAIGRRVIDNAGLQQPSGVVGIFDKRMEHPLWHQAFDLKGEAEDAYRQAIDRSAKRGWNQLYRGGQLNTPGLS